MSWGKYYENNNMNRKLIFQKISIIYIICGCSSIYEKEKKIILNVKEEFHLLSKMEMIENLKIKGYICNPDGRDKFFCVKKSDNILPPYTCVFKLNISYKEDMKDINFQEPICAGF